MANEAERRRWNDERWVAAWSERERLTDAVTATLLAAARPEPGQRVCDIGCGGGGLTVKLAGLVVPGGSVVGLDLSAPLVEQARRRASGLSGIRFVVMDVQTDALDEEFDLVVSQFGVMFFDESRNAFRAVRALLRPGGRLVFACWREIEHNPWHATAAQLGPFLPAPPELAPGKNRVGPFSLGDDALVRDVLADAGLAVVRVEPYATTVCGPAAAVVDRSQLAFMGVAPEQEDEALARVLEHLDRFAVGPDEYEFPLAYRVYEVVRAGR